MIAILEYIQLVFFKLVSILNIKPFVDFPISILQIILSSIFLKFIFRIIYGGFKELDTTTNFFLGEVSKNISNKKRKKQLANKNEKKQ